jgi:hypothetical protein
MFLVAVLAAVVYFGSSGRALAEYVAPTAAQCGGAGLGALSTAQCGPSELTDFWSSAPEANPEFPSNVPDDPASPSGVGRTALFFGVLSRPSNSSRPTGPQNYRDSGGPSPAAVSPSAIIPPSCPAGLLTLKSSARWPEPFAPRLFRPPRPA